MEYLAGGTMRHKVSQKEYSLEELAGFYAAEFTLAVEHLHKQDIMQR